MCKSKLEWKQSYSRKRIKKNKIKYKKSMKSNSTHSRYKSKFQIAFWALILPQFIRFITFICCEFISCQISETSFSFSYFFFDSSTYHIYLSYILYFLVVYFIRSSITFILLLRFLLFLTLSCWFLCRFVENPVVTHSNCESNSIIRQTWNG